MAEDAWHTCKCKVLLHWMKLSRPTGSVQCSQGSHFTVLVTTMNRPGFALLCKYSNLTDITKIQRQCVKGRTKWMIVVEEELVKCDQQANGSLGPKTNRYDIITDSNRFDMSKKKWNVEDW